MVSAVSSLPSMIPSFPFSRPFLIPSLSADQKMPQQGNLIGTHAQDKIILRDAGMFRRSIIRVADPYRAPSRKPAVESVPGGR